MASERLTIGRPAMADCTGPVSAFGVFARGHSCRMFALATIAPRSSMTNGPANALLYATNAAATSSAAGHRPPAATGASWRAAAIGAAVRRDRLACFPRPIALRTLTSPFAGSSLPQIFSFIAPLLSRALAILIVTGQPKEGE